MKANEFIYNNRKILSYASLVLTTIGGILSYIYYGTEPYETIGGFLCGFGFTMFLIFISLKQPQNPF